MNDYRIKSDFNSQTIVTAEKLIKYIKIEKKFPDLVIPKGIIISYQKVFTNFLENNFETKKIRVLGMDLYFFSYKNVPMAVASGFGIGAPAASVILEELTALGRGNIERIISVGTAGAIAEQVHVGDIVVIEKALREEGTSFHYLTNAQSKNQFSFPSQNLTKRMMATCEELKIPFHFGPGWTTDAPYRETINKIKRYQRKKILAVDMEASALFAVALYKKIEIATAFTISDSLSNLEWSPKFDSVKTKGGLEKLFNISINTLLL
ncbi:MAG: nucleoside phosphorylase [Oligoflexia bacterium]|nr:nucleoside phosphorylase [Oligoflexia bacterium]